MQDDTKIYGQIEAAKFIGSTQQYIQELVKKKKLNPETLEVGKVKVQVFEKMELIEFLTLKKKAQLFKKKD